MEKADGLSQITPDTRGLGAPLSKIQIQERQREEEEEARREAEEAAKPPPPPRQYRVDTTGLSTANLPPPPGRKDGADGRNSVALPPPIGVKPKLPPRLPPRQNSNPATPPPVYTEQDAHEGKLNQGSLDRLSTAGLSIPGLGIHKQPPPGPSSPAVNASQLNELQSRFSRLSSPTSVKSESPSEGTTFSQKQAALKTASSFRNDPSSVSMDDARNAASIANNFRERHGDQVRSGWQSTNKLNNKYGIANKVGAFGATATAQPTGPVVPNSETNGAGVLGKKRPPAPPVKRAELTGAGISNDSAPPPIPLSSKPKPSVSG
jgi:hypothetical protein